MKRNDLREHAGSFAREAEQKGLKYWEEKKYPITEELEIDGEDAQVEYVVLEFTDNYLHLGINLTRRNSFLDSCFPIGTSVILERTDDSKSTGMKEYNSFFHCPDCGNKVYSQAESCPKCAWNNPASDGIVLPVGHWIVYMSTGFLLTLFITLFLMRLGLGNL